MVKRNIEISQQKIADFCRKWKVIELALFGSVLNRDFRSDSDIDVLVSFSEDAQWSLFDLVRMQDELKEIFGREVDLVEKAALRNPFRRYSILCSKEVIYAV
ncbi:MAG: nucleotidyltransferase family protein [Candidatus Brocadiaceae bacterium]|nr:nucleotidyltransferase family protein [Candidatus Brocadiaceae bacterium]